MKMTALNDRSKLKPDRVRLAVLNYAHTHKRVLRPSRDNCQYLLLTNKRDKSRYKRDIEVRSRDNFCRGKEISSWGKPRKSGNLTH